MQRLLVLCLLLLAACGRPLTEAERAFTDTLHGVTLDPARIRLVEGNLIGDVVRHIPARPRLACRDRIWPPPQTDPVPAGTAAVTLFQNIYFRDDLYSDDYLSDYPNRLNLVAAMLLAHEVTHVWQWQNRAVTGYHPLRAASEHVPGTDPYLFDTAVTHDFLDYSDEQQGALVDEFVCCRALDPDGERTERLYEMLRAIFPDVARFSAVPMSGVRLPWESAEISGICSD